MNPPEILNFCHPSQLEQRYGGTAPNVTQYWPPTMPPITEEHDQKVYPLVPREHYARFAAENPKLTRMPRQLRQDLPPLPGEEEPKAPEVCETLRPQDIESARERVPLESPLSDRGADFEFCNLDEQVLNNGIHAPRDTISQVRLSELNDARQRRTLSAAEIEKIAVSRPTRVLKPIVQTSETLPTSQQGFLSRVLCNLV